MAMVAGVRPLCGIAALSVLLALTGCGMTEKKLDDLENRIRTLKSAGVPDTLLQSAEVLLYQFKTARSSRNPAVATIRPSADSLIMHVERAEAWYHERAPRAEQLATACREAARTSAEQLKGMHRTSVDSLAAMVDSLVAQGRHIQAATKCDELAALTEAMTTAQQTAEKLARTVAGRWRSVRDVVGEGAKAAETRDFTFNRNGSLVYTHEMKGTTDPTLREDWQFLSWGSWQLKGDTVHMAIAREKCTRQNFSFLRDGRWVTERKPTYDTTITDGSKDLLIVYKDLQDEFVRY